MACRQRADEFVVLGQHAEPQAVRAEALGHHGSGVELVALPGRGAVDDDAPERPAAAQALGGVLAAEHLEDCIHTFAVGQFQHALLVVNLAVVDAVVEPELLHALQLLVGRRGSVGFDRQQLSNLDRGRAHAAGDGVNQHTALVRVVPLDGLHRVGGHARLPVRQVGGKKVHRKGGRLHRGPAGGLRPQQLGLHGDLLGGSAVLRVAHHALAGCFHDAGEFAAGDEGRSRRSGIGSAGGKGVGKVHADGFHAHDHLARLGLGIGHVAHFQNFRTTGTRNDDGFHEIDSTTVWQVRQFRAG